MYKCRECGEKIGYKQFIYVVHEPDTSYICLECFKESVLSIVNRLQDDNEKNIILYLLNAAWRVPYEMIGTIEEDIKNAKRRDLSRKRLAEIGINFNFEHTIDQDPSDEIIKKIEERILRVKKGRIFD